MPFVVFEGLDGSGKSSLMNALEQHLKSEGTNYLRTREPGGTPIGDEIRELILRKGDHPPTPRTELLLYEASRAQHCDQVIRPALERGQWVLCDRFTASSVAFQAGGREIESEWVDQLNAFATNELVPDLVVLLDLSVEESRKRRNLRSLEGGAKEDRIESEADSFHERVRRSFLEQSQKDTSRWLVLNAGQTPQELWTHLRDVLRARRWLKS